MAIDTYLLFGLAMLLIAALPLWSYNEDWGYSAGGFVGLLFLVALVLTTLNVI